MLIRFSKKFIHNMLSTTQFYAKNKNQNKKSMTYPWNIVEYKHIFTLLTLNRQIVSD